MASETDIANQALVLIGASKITDIDSATEVNAVRVNTFFDSTRDALLRRYQPKFATKRTSITANVTPPAFGRANAYDLPSDYLAPLAPYPEDDILSLDWIIEGDQIVTDDASPLKLRYTAQITTTTSFDATFVKLLAAALAVECCEAITQSTSKKGAADEYFKKALAACVEANSFEQVNHITPEDSWVNIRFYGEDNTKSWYGG